MISSTCRIRAAKRCKEITDQRLFLKFVYPNHDPNSAASTAINLQTSTRFVSRKAKRIFNSLQAHNHKECCTSRRLYVHMQSKCGEGNIICCKLSARISAPGFCCHLPNSHADEIFRRLGLRLVGRCRAAFPHLESGDSYSVQAFAPHPVPEILVAIELITHTISLR